MIKIVQRKIRLEVDEDLVDEDLVDETAATGI
jgi:hypothetical protein